jgi:tellurite methyltransferase
MKTMQSKRWALLMAIFLIWVLGICQAQAKPKDKDRWNEKYNTETFIFGEKPTRFIAENYDLLRKGKVLDLAMGEGRNAVFLATKGFDVLGMDISEKGLEKADALAKANGVSIETKVVDLENTQLEKDGYDSIICTYYMQRDLYQQMKTAVKSGGRVLVETYNVDYLNYSNFPRKYLLETNELLEIFKDFKIIRYEAYDNGKEAYSAIIAERP